MLSELREQAEALGIKVDGRWGEERLKQEIARNARDEGAWADHGGEAHEVAQSGNQVEYIQSRAKAQWEGQSISLPRHERIRRIKKALEEKGYNPELVDFNGLQ